MNCGSKLQITKPGLAHQLCKHAHPDSIAISAAESLEVAVRAQEKWKASREGGLRKFTSGLQRLATSLSSFMVANSGIVDAVRITTGPYGEAGYQAISILLTVFPMNLAPSVGSH